VISAPSTLRTHLEPVMGTVVAIYSPTPLPIVALDTAVSALHEADRVFSTWNATSPISRLRAGTVGLEDLDRAAAAQISEVIARCQLAREITSGAFDPWAMPGGFDPTGLVKGWAASRCLEALTTGNSRAVMVNAGGDIAVTGGIDGHRWRVGVRHPAQPDALAAIVEVSHAIATSGDYERPGQLIDPATGRAARNAASATVTGIDLDLVDALATGLAVAGQSMLRAIDELPGYEAYLIADSGRHYATPRMAFVDAQPSQRSPNPSLR
jgi:FAD:protein FMN transferase